MNKKNKRHYKVDLTREAVALRQLRIEKGLSLREVGRRIERSEAIIRHIETGRMDPPKGERLRALLELYGIKYKAFRTRVNNVEIASLPRQELQTLVKMIPEGKVDQALKLLKVFLD